MEQKGALQDGDEDRRNWTLPNTKNDHQAEQVLSVQSVQHIGSAAAASACSSSNSASSSSSTTSSKSTPAVFQTTSDGSGYLPAYLQIPDEVWARIFDYAKYPITLSLVCKYWNKIYRLNFCYFESTLNWNSGTRNLDAQDSELTNKVITGLEFLIQQYGRSPRTLFAIDIVAQQAFFSAILLERLKFAKRMLEDDIRIDPAMGRNKAIRVASGAGDAEFVEYLLSLPKVDPAAEGDYAIRSASQSDRVEVIKLLLKDSRVNPASHDNWCIKRAARHGHDEVVKVLLSDSRVDPTAEDNFAIREASKHGYKNVVKLLLKDPRVDPTADSNSALRKASKHGYFRVVKLLLADQRVDPAVLGTQYEKDYKTTPQTYPFHSR
eukprot:TRINITY_DN7170_c0_g1_i1.p1 TRINITY_DN7170_c0_g1~~TRINITY_DN7170_c0_g1_i1.p1  ORF type:complete len:379 (-),score=76.58 TRINITY_DN7170_c0_g1_i1:290-1426(-)